MLKSIPILLILRYSFLILICCILCGSNCQRYGNPNKKNGCNLEDSQYRDIKWYLYSLNYKSIAYCCDSLIERSPLECEIKISRILRYGDTTEVIFNFIHEKTKNKCVLSPIYYQGVGMVNDSIRFFDIGGWLDDFGNSDSIYYYLNMHNLAFIEYLYSYKGELSSWLDEEKTRRIKGY